MNAVLARDSGTSINQLGKLLRLHHWSLPMYLANARPWVGQQQRQAGELLEQIAQDHQYLVAAIGNRILELGGSPIPSGGFPMEFTDLHDLSASFVLQQVLFHQRRLEAEIADGVSQLGRDAESQSLAHEAAGLARGHRELLEQVLSD